MTTPAFSVILPVRNRPRLFRRSLASVLRQTFENFEVVVVDDASTEDIAGVCDSFSDSRIRYVRLRENSGACVARNEGVSTARAEWVSFQDSDDEWHDDWLATVWSHIQTCAGSCLFYGGYEVISEDAVTMGPSSPWMEVSRDARVCLLHGNFIALPSVVLPKGVFSTVRGFDPRLKRLQDWDLLLRVLRIVPARFIDGRYMTIHREDSVISSNHGYTVQASALLLEKYREDFSRFPHAESNLRLEMTKAYLNLGDTSNARRQFLRSLRLRPQLRHGRWAFRVLKEMWTKKDAQ